MKEINIYSQSLASYDIAMILQNIYFNEGVESAIEYAQKMIEQKQKFLATWQKVYSSEKRETVLKQCRTRIKDTEDIIKMLDDFIEGNKKREVDYEKEI